MMKHITKANIKILSIKENRMVFDDIIKHDVQTPNEIANDLKLANSIVQTSIKTLVDANLVNRQRTMPTASGAMDFYSASIDGLKLKREIESGFGLEF
ncbi:MAG: hypothetical protein WCE94_10910 [Candidatus Methanoperedens sp.]